MASNKYVITIKNVVEEEDESPTAKTPKSSTTDKPKISETKKNILKGIAAFKVAENYADRIYQQNLNLVQIRTGQVHYQQKLQFIKDTTKNILDTVVISAAIGVITGNIGAAALGIAKGAADYALDVYQRQELINAKREVENMTIRRNNIRAGASGSRLNALSE